jgi:thymidylate kinase
MIVYFSGPHGAGKSSLIRGICEYSSDFIAYPDRLKFAHVDEPALRQKSKIAKIFQEYCDQLDFEKENPDKIVLGDRCIYDCMVYSNAYQKIGWISAEQNNDNKRLSEILNECYPSHLVVLNPRYETLVSHIQQRWKRGEKKWREENQGYLKAVHDEFESLPEYFRGKNLLYLGKEAPVEDEVDETISWMNEKGIWHDNSYRLVEESFSRDYEEVHAY